MDYLKSLEHAGETLKRQKDSPSETQEDLLDDSDDVLVIEDEHDLDEVKLDNAPDEIEPKMKGKTK